MPTFRTAQPKSISTSMAQLLGSSPNLSGKDIAEIGSRAARANRDDMLAEKARLEVEDMRRQQTSRDDPNTISEYASLVAGVPLDKGRRLYGSQRNEVVKPTYAVDEEGNAFPSVTMARPEEVTPDQEQAFNRSIASFIATKLASGKTNAAQMTQAGGNLQTQGIRDRIAAEPDVGRQNQLKNAIVPGFREPFSNTNAQGVTTNQETGTSNVTQQSIYDAAVAAQNALAAQREERATDLEETRPSRISATNARAGASAASAGLSTARTGEVGKPRAAVNRTQAQEDIDAERAAKLRSEREAREQTEISSTFRRDTTQKGNKLGRYHPGTGGKAGRFEVLGPDGRQVGWYTK